MGSDPDKRRLTGTIHGFADGYGFILGDDGNVYRVLHCDLAEDDADDTGDFDGIADDLGPDDKVEFDTDPERGQDIATNVKLVSRGG